MKQGRLAQVEGRDKKNIIVLKWQSYTIGRYLQN